MSDFCGEEFRKNGSSFKTSWKIINEVVRGSPAPQQYSLNVGGNIVWDLDRVCDLFAQNFLKIGETVQSEAIVNRKWLTEKSTFKELWGQYFEMKLEPLDLKEIRKIVSSIKSNSAGAEATNSKNELIRFYSYWVRSWSYELLREITNWDTGTQMTTVTQGI